jgi:hypothetical protein
MTTMTTTTIDNWKRQNREESAKRLNRWIKRFDKWMGLCDNLSDAREKYGENSLQTTTAFAAWEKGLKSMPSKNSKHTAYADGRTLARHLIENGFEAPEFLTSVVDLRTVLALYMASEVR